MGSFELLLFMHLNRNVITADVTGHARVRMFAVQNQHIKVQLHHNDWGKCGLCSKEHLYLFFQTNQLVSGEGLQVMSPAEVLNKDPLR